MGIRHLLNQSITYENPSGSRDLHGKVGFATAATCKTRFERKYRTIVTAEREREPIHGVFIVEPDSDIEVGARITYDSTKYRVLERDDAPGRNGRLHHIELMCQLWSYGS